MNTVASFIWQPAFCLGFYAVFLTFALPCVLLARVVKMFAKFFLSNFVKTSGTPSRSKYVLMDGADAACCLPSIDTEENRPTVTAFFTVSPAAVRNLDDHERPSTNHRDEKPVFDGSLLVAKFEEYFEAIDGNQSGTTEVKLSEGERDMFDKLRRYPVRKNGYFFWKLDKRFDVRRHVGLYRRYSAFPFTYRESL
jgi:hypothetical protein